MFENIPEELKSERAWVNVWDGSKVPMQTGVRKGASSVSPATWGTFAEAVENVENGVYQGIGYVFHGNGIVGIDIDAGYDSEGFISPLAADIIKTCRSYTERSRSGRGFHILVRGSLPFKGKNNQKGVEMYQESRYFIMTGRTTLYTKIVENQDAIDTIIGKYFADLPKVATQTNGSRIYNPVYRAPKNGKILLRPEYPPIAQGGRNLCLTSLAGQLHSRGYSKGEIYKELLHANSTACKPPLPRSEVELIVNSVTKYKR